MLTVDSELDVDKLGRADHLANHVGKETPLLLAYWRLKAIATSAPEFGRWWWRLLGYALSAAMSAQLFFDGDDFCLALSDSILPELHSYGDGDRFVNDIFVESNLKLGFEMEMEILSQAASGMVCWPWRWVSP